MKKSIFKSILILIVLGFPPKVSGQSNKEVFGNNDLNIENLRGPVNYVLSKGTYKGETNLELSKQYYKNGKLKQVKVTLPGRDDLEFLMNKLNPEEFLFETRVLYNFGEHDEFIYTRSEYDIMGWGREVDYNFFYNSDEKISRVESKSNKISSGGAIRSFSYDKEGNLEKRITPRYEVHYKWSGKKLVSKTVYHVNDGSEFYSYKINYSPTKVKVDLLKTSKYDGTSEALFTFNLDVNGRIVERKIENFNKGRQGKYVANFSVTKYEYNSEGALVKSKGERSFLNERSQKYVINFRNWNEIIRDNHGNITRFKTKKEKITDYGESHFEENNKVYMEWKYTYDSKGNWISRTCNEVKENDMKIANQIEEVNRKISYFSEPPKTPKTNENSSSQYTEPKNDDITRWEKLKSLSTYDFTKLQKENSPPFYAVLKNSKDYLLSEPKSGAYVSEFTKKDQILVLEKYKDSPWCKIRVNGKEGYILNFYIEPLKKSD